MSINEDDITAPMAARVLLREKSLHGFYHPVMGTPYIIGCRPVINMLDEIALQDGTPHERLLQTWKDEAAKKSDD